MLKSRRCHRRTSDRVRNSIETKFGRWGDSIDFPISSWYRLKLHGFSLPKIERKARSVIHLSIGDGANGTVQRLQRLTECIESVALLSPSPPVFSGAPDGSTEIGPGEPADLNKFADGERVRILSGVGHGSRLLFGGWCIRSTSDKKV